MLCIEDGQMVGSKVNGAGICERTSESHSHICPQYNNVRLDKDTVRRTKKEKKPAWGQPVLPTYLPTYLPNQNSKPKESNYAS